jgi:hypothetical protein
MPWRIAEPVRPVKSRADGVFAEHTQLNTWYVIATVLAVLFIQQWWTRSQQVETLPYSRFAPLVDAGKVKEIYLTERYTRGTLTDALPDGRSPFIVTRHPRAPLEGRRGPRRATISTRLQRSRPASPGRIGPTS